MFAPWFDVMELRITRAIENSRKGDGPAGTPSISIWPAPSSLTERRRPPIAACPPSSTNLFEPRRLSRNHGFQLLNSSSVGVWMTCQGRAKGLDPKLRVIFTEQLDQIRKLAIGPNAAMVIRSQELELVGKAEKLIVENTNLSVRLTAAVDRLVSEAEVGYWGVCQGCASVQRLSAQTLLSFAVLSLLSSTLIVSALCGTQYHWSLDVAQQRHACDIERRSSGPH